MKVIRWRPWSVAASGWHLYNAVVYCVRDEHIARRVHRHTLGNKQSAAHWGLGAAKADALCVNRGR